MSTPPGPGPAVEADSRGILAPALLRDRTAFTRYTPDPPLAGLVDWFWCVRWDLPGGAHHRQPILQHPAANLTVSTPDARRGTTAIEARLTGTATRLVDRELAGRGWTVGFKSTVGGMGAFTPVPLADLVDRVVDVDVLDGLVGDDLVRAVITAGPDDDPRATAPDGDPGPQDAAREPHRVAVLAAALESVLRGADPERVAEAREVAAIARVAETDRSVRRLDQLAARAGTGPRALQRLFARRVGVSPTWVLRRYRLLDAAEAVRDGEQVVWADLAAALGYSDQAHLVRDFRGALGTTPEAYARAQRL